MFYNALDISKFFIKKQVSPLKLQKLLFYSQVWYFVKNKNLLFRDNIESWVLGPVVYNVWSNFRYIRRGDIINPDRHNSIEFPSDIKDHLEEIWSIYGSFTGLELVDLTHKEKLWLDARGNTPNDRSSNNTIIIDSVTTSYISLDHNGKIPHIDPSIEGLAKFNGNTAEFLS